MEGGGGEGRWEGEVGGGGGEGGGRRGGGEGGVGRNEEWGRGSSGEEGGEGKSGEEWGGGKSVGEGGIGEGPGQEFPLQARDTTTCRYAKNSTSCRYTPTSRSVSAGSVGSADSFGSAISSASQLFALQVGELGALADLWAPVEVVGAVPVEPLDPVPVGPFEPPQVEPFDPAPVEPFAPVPVGPFDPAPVEPFEPAPAPVGPLDPAPVEPIDPAPAELAPKNEDANTNKAPCPFLAKSILEYQAAYKRLARGAHLTDEEYRKLVEEKVQARRQKVTAEQRGSQGDGLRGTMMSTPRSRKSKTQGPGRQELSHHKTKVRTDNSRTRDTGAQESGSGELVTPTAQMVLAELANTPRIPLTDESKDYAEAPAPEQREVGQYVSTVGGPCCPLWVAGPVVWAESEAEWHAKRNSRNSRRSLKLDAIIPREQPDEREQRDEEAPQKNWKQAAKKTAAPPPGLAKPTPSPRSPPESETVLNAEDDHETRVGGGVRSAIWCVYVVVEGLRTPPPYQQGDPLWVGGWSATNKL